MPDDDKPSDSANQPERPSVPDNQLTTHSAGDVVKPTSPPNVEVTKGE